KNVVSGEEAQFEYTVERKTGENVGTYDITVTNVKELGNYEIKTEGAKFTINKASNDTNKVSVEDTNATYDGEDHTVGKVETTVNDSEVLYSKDGKEWSKEIPSFTEAGTYEVYLKAVNENYQDSEVFTGHVVIAKRAITVTAQSSSKVFDNVALVQPGYTLSENALVKEQTMEVEITGSQQAVGTSENKVSKVTVFAGVSDKTSNYEIQTISGTLRVTAAITPVTPIPQLPLTPPFIPGVVVVNPEVQVPNNTTPKTDGKEVVKKKETPKAADKGTWALLNLLLAGGTLVLAIFLLVSKRKKEDEEEEEGKDHIIYTRKTWLKLTSSVIAILSVIVFCVTEDITLKMVFVDTWTLWMVVFFVVQVGTFYFGRKWKEEAAKQEDYIVE
ncbi:MAG: MBG domain-containing protein, partial [Longicatena sp.]